MRRILWQKTFDRQLWLERFTLPIPDTYKSEIQRYLENAETGATVSSPVRAVIVPHAGYIYSGPVAAYAYKLLQREPAPNRIILMGPSHRAWFQGDCCRRCGCLPYAPGQPAC